MLRTRASWSKACLFIKQFAIYKIWHSVEDYVTYHVSWYWQQCQCQSVIFSFLGNQTNTFPLLWNDARVAEGEHPLSDCVPTCLDHVSCDSVHAVCLISTKATAFLKSCIVTSLCIFEARSMGCQCGTGLCRTLLKDYAHRFACLFSPFDNVDPYLALVGPDRTRVLPVIFLAMRCTCLTSFRGAAFTVFCACPSSLSRMSF